VGNASGEQVGPPPTKVAVVEPHGDAEAGRPYELAGFQPDGRWEGPATTDTGVSERR
jgi:hypothetical protein